MTETTAERYFDTLFYNIQEVQFRTAHLDIRTKTMQYLLIAILAVCTIHLVLFIIKWICDNRSKRPDTNNRDLTS